VTTLRDVLANPELLRVALKPRKHGQECRCEDCYFEAIGEEVERRPIGGVFPRRG